MPTLRNISPLGALRIPAYGIRVGRGETFEVTDEQAADLLKQADNFEAVDDKPKAADHKKKVTS